MTDEIKNSLGITIYRKQSAAVERHERNPVIAEQKVKVKRRKEKKPRESKVKAEKEIIEKQELSQDETTEINDKTAEIIRGEIEQTKLPVAEVKIEDHIDESLELWQRELTEINEGLADQYETEKDKVFRESSVKMINQLKAERADLISRIALIDNVLVLYNEPVYQPKPENKNYHSRSDLLFFILKKANHLVMLEDIIETYMKERNVEPQTAKYEMALAITPLKGMKKVMSYRFGLFGRRVHYGLTEMFKEDGTPKKQFIPDDVKLLFEQRKGLPLKL